MSAEFDKLKASVEKWLDEVKTATHKIHELEARVQAGQAAHDKLADHVHKIADGQNPDAEAMLELAKRVDSHLGDLSLVDKPDPGPVSGPVPATNPAGPPPPSREPDAFSAEKAKEQPTP